MSKLQTALRSGEETLESLASKYSIKVKPHPKYPALVQLKYSQIDSPMGNELIQECRGCILDTSRNFEFVARPFDKFFNQGEGHAAPIDWETARVQEKLDGSLMIVYYYDDQWNVATSGTPDAGGEVNNKPGTTFAQLFDLTWRELGYSIKSLDPNLTYMFELMTKYNRVVVNHPKSRLVLIGVRDRLTGDEHSVHRDLFRNEFEVVRWFNDLNGEEKVQASMEHFSGLQQEGYVVVDHNFNRVKIKHPTYLAAHHLVGSLSPKNLLELVRQGEMPEILAYFPEWTTEADILCAKYKALVMDAEGVYENVRDIPVQKDFALAIKDSPHRSALFALRAGKTPSVKQFYCELRIESLADMLGLKKETP